MAGDLLANDVAFVTAMQIVEVFAVCLREEEQRDAFEAVFTQVKAGLECFQTIRQDRMQRRMEPGVN
jgi:hypothetical protein